MQIQLNQSEIEEALSTYMSRLGISSSIDSIDFTAGRGSTGISATIELSSAINQTKSATVTEIRKAEPLDVETEAVDEEELETSEETSSATGESLFS